MLYSTSISTGALFFQCVQPLAARRIPFLFLTGYGNLAVIPEQFREAPIISKPFDTEEMKSALAQMLGLPDDFWTSDPRRSAPH